MSTKPTLKILLPLMAIMLLLTVPLVYAEKNEPSGLKFVCDIWPPYQFETSEGQLIGFSLELTQSVLAEMDMTIEETISYPWKRALSTLETGRADGLFSANYTKDRTAFARYPEEVLVESPWLIWTRSNTAITSLADLKGKRIGVVLGYSYTPEFWDFIENNCVVERVFSDKTNFKKLSVGRLDAIIAEYGNGVHITQELGIDDIKPVWDFEIKRDGLYVIFNKRKFDKKFVQEFSNRLKAFKKTKEYRAIEAKYFHRKM